MFNFFTSSDSRVNDCYYLSGNDHNHIKNVLRMQVGDTFLVSESGKSNLCQITELTPTSVTAKIIEEDYQSTELPLKIYLFQGLPKSDKMELIIQKTVELGVYCIVPVEMSRCVVKIEEKKKKNKTDRWQAISESAAKQSKRNIIPEVHSIISFKEALSMAEKLDAILIPYEAENGMESTRSAIPEILKSESIAIFIGPEGGFDPKEIEEAIRHNGKVISLGKRILRTETAAITAVAMCMLHSEMYSEGESI